MDQQTINIMEMIGCNKTQFESIIKGAAGKISMSSGSWHADYYIFDEKGLLAKYNHKGSLIFNR